MKKITTITTAMLIAATMTYAQGGKGNRPERDTEKGAMHSRTGSGMRGGAGQAERAPGGGSRKRGEMMERLLGNPEIREKLGLSEEDVQKIQGELHEIKIKMIDLKAEMEKVGLKQARTMMDKEVDEDRLYDMVKEAGAIRTEMGLLQMKKMLLFRKHIDPEKMEQVREQLREKMRARMKNRKQSRSKEGGRGSGEESRDHRGNKGNRDDSKAKKR